jgi:4-hydroxy-tetrahydrodipicolinate synthase
MPSITGVWLPVVTPFRDGAVDLAGYERLLEHYLALGVTGIFPLGTTGESPTLDDDEMEALVDRTLAVVACRPSAGFVPAAADARVGGARRRARSRPGRRGGGGYGVAGTISQRNERSGTVPLTGSAASVAIAAL